MSFRAERRNPAEAHNKPVHPYRFREIATATTLPRNDIKLFYKTSAAIYIAALLVLELLTGFEPVTC